MIRIGAGRWDIPLEAAKVAVAGYAFATRAVCGQEQAPKWGYKTYDCVPASPVPEFSDLDIFVADGLSAQLGVRSIASLQVAARRAGPDLANAARHGREFADLSLEELSDEPPEQSTGWLLTQAYRQMENAPDVGLARAHKVLHHKYPLLVPLLDNITAEVYQDAQKHRLQADWNLWQHIHAEISENRAELEQLRDWFRDQANRRGGVPLGLPRLHDILLWLHASQQWEDALSEGRKLPRGTLSTDELRQELDAYLEARRHAQKSPNTIDLDRRKVLYFLDWLDSGKLR